LIPAPKSVRDTPFDSGIGHLSLIRLGRHCMGTRWEIVVPAGAKDAVPWADNAFDALAEEESRLSVFLQESEVSRLNRLPVGASRRLSDELFDLLERCSVWWGQTEGCLDVAVGGMIEGWGFLHGPPRVPETVQRESWVAEGGISRLSLDGKRKTATWLGASGGLNLGAVGKGFGLDRMAGILRGAGWQSVMIHGGRSSVLARGIPPGESQGWRVALRHPARDSVLAEVELANQAMGTSAATYKHLEHEGKRLGHVLDPRTAWPVMDTQAVSVLAPDAAEADALSTAIFVGGQALAEKLVQDREDLGVLYMPTEGPVRLLGAMAHRFHLL